MMRTGAIASDGWWDAMPCVANPSNVDYGLWAGGKVHEEAQQARMRLHK